MLPSLTRSSLVPLASDAARLACRARGPCRPLLSRLARAPGLSEMAERPAVAVVGGLPVGPRRAVLAALARRAGVAGQTCRANSEKFFFENLIHCFGNLKIY